MKHLFESPRLKVKRANQHIDAVEKLIVDFSNDPGHKIVSKTDPSGLTKLMFEPGDSLSAEVGLSVGDAVHNLRAALDHVMTALVTHLVPGCTKEHIYFPIRQDEAGVKDALKNGEVGKAMATTVGQKIAAVILDAIKPYGTREQLLPMLSKLDNIDKHRFILTLFSAGGMKTGTATLGSGNVFRNSHFISYRNTPMVLSGGLKLEGDFKPVVEVLLDEAELPKYEPLLPALKNISKVVSQSIDAIERCVT